MECFNCGKKIEVEYLVCPYCGIKISKESNVSNTVIQSGDGNSNLSVNGNNNFNDNYYLFNNLQKVTYQMCDKETIVYRNDNTLKFLSKVFAIIGAVSSIITIYEFVINKVSTESFYIFLIPLIICCFYNVYKYVMLLKHKEYTTFLGAEIRKRNNSYYKYKNYVQGECPICGGQVQEKQLEYDSKLKRYGVCDRHPLDHIFSIEEDLSGVAIGPNEKAKINFKWSYMK
ncbi:hypothetical protein FDF86_06235 [Clostridium botulinum]|nr:hypothetical protein [Clostridium botulinum]NFF21948.1 hypothetical protein [Clostridium botulinum]NFF35500.1 hypothetical protein [Clostridium botulinum]NFI49650.1 hypothetical protein [Clostridium botulinum]NFI58580.1 hypothetical protein [Clostridium botulinum]